MTTDDFTEAARAEAERYVPAFTSTDYTPNGLTAIARLAHVEGWKAARDYLAAQEPTAAELEAARVEVRNALREQYKARYNLGRHDSIDIGDEIDIDETAEEVARAALSAARAARRDEEKRDG